MKITGYLVHDLVIQAPSREASHDSGLFFFSCGFFSMLTCPRALGLPYSNALSSGQRQPSTRSNSWPAQRLT